jgi:hypothetical protein
MSEEISIDVLVERALNALRLLSKTACDERNPPAGVYAFLSHNSHATSALQDCKRIIQRLQTGRRRLTELAYEEEALASRELAPGPLPENLQAVMREGGDLNEYMKLDLESLYMFGGILLDQWSLQAIAVGNIPCAKQYPFRELVDALDQHSNGPLLSLWDKTRADMLWLYYQLRFYRNRFIIHANRPWQRGTTRSVYGSDFNLFIPTPPGWLDDEALDNEIMELIQLTPDRIKKSAVGYWERRPGRIIEVLFDVIPSFDRSTREKISNLFSKKGGSTPDFNVLATRLVRFVAEGTESLIPIAKEHIWTIDLGDPHSTHEAMWSRRRDRTQ